MVDKDYEYPDASFARAFRQEEEQEFLCLFNSQQISSKKQQFQQFYMSIQIDFFFQPIPAKDKIKSSIPDRDEYGNVSEIKKNDDLIRFRNGIIHDTLSSVDIQEIVKAGGSIIKIYEGIIYEKNLEVNPYKEFVTRLFALRKKYKEEKNKVRDTIVKLLLNSLYGKMIQKDMNTKAYIWNANTFNNRYDPDLLKKFE